MADVTLRDVQDSDLPVFFGFRQDPEANRMAAFTAPDPGDQEAFDALWDRIRSNPEIVARTIESGGQVVGDIGCFDFEGERMVAYWIGRDYWGRGIATEALRRFLTVVTERPLVARVAEGNPGSLRVLTKVGFTVVGDDRAYAHGRGAETAELILRLT